MQFTFRDVAYLPMIKIHTHFMIFFFVLLLSINVCIVLILMVYKQLCVCLRDCIHFGARYHWIQNGTRVDEPRILLRKCIFNSQQKMLNEWKRKKNRSRKKRDENWYFMNSMKNALRFFRLSFYRIILIGGNFSPSISFCQLGMPLKWKIRKHVKSKWLGNCR